MTEKKYDKLLKISVVVLAISTVMLCVSGYNVFFRNNRASENAAAVTAVKDSLRKVYSATVKKLDENFNMAWNSTDTVAAGLDAKLTEFNKLRNDISGILKNGDASVEDLTVATEKVKELQQKVEALDIRNSNVEAENRRLQALIQQLIANNKTTSQTNAGTTQRKSARAQAGIVAAELHLFAVAVSNNKEAETTTADAAEKMVGSFSVKNAADADNTELMIVVLQPDGKVLQGSVWESGTFDTKEGKRVYSRKIFFDPSDDEKQLNFSLNSERFIKGEYVLQVWYNGSMIGRVSRMLG